MNLTAKSDQSIFDISLIAYQDASRVYDLIDENPDIDNINSELTGLNLTYTPATVTQKEVIKTVTSQKPNVTIRSTQSVFDIALQYYGGAENVFDFIEGNGLDSILSDPTGVNLNYELNNTFAPLFYRTFNIDVATKPYDVGVSGSYRITEGGIIRLLESGDYRILE